MYLNSIYLSLKVVSILVLWGQKYILFGYMDPLGKGCRALGPSSCFDNPQMLFSLLTNKNQSMIERFARALRQ